MEIVGRITQNAVIHQLKDERKVVNFSIAVNDYYKQKGTDKAIQTVLYINCAYWISTSISEKLTKGSIVELNGRLQLNAYTGFDGEAKATLNCHVSSIKLHHSSKQPTAEPKEKEPGQESPSMEENIAPIMATLPDPDLGQAESVELTPAGTEMITSGLKRVNPRAFLRK